jgi:hypothetical protein
MTYNKDKPKTKKVSFRVNQSAYDFLKEMSEIIGIEISELMRKIVLLYFMEYFMNEKPTMTLSERYEFVKKKFLTVFTDDFLNKINN